MKTIKHSGQWILTETENPEAVLVLMILKNQTKDFTMNVSEAKKEYIKAMINELKELASFYGSFHVTEANSTGFHVIQWDHEKDEYWPYTLRFTAINDLGQGLIGGTKAWESLDSLSLEDIQTFYFFITNTIVKEAMIVFENRVLIKKTLEVIKQSSVFTEKDYQLISQMLSVKNKC